MANDIEILFELIRKRYKTPEKRKRYEVYVENLVNRGVPPILSFRHLADTLDLPPRTLHGMVFQTHLFYKRFLIPKRSGGRRQIISPHLSLDIIQRWIGQNILQVGFTEFSNCVIGYMPKKSIKDHVSPHIRSDCLIKFDLKDFFPSIDNKSVCHIFLELGYVHSVARTLAALVTIDSALPQGASTSPIISNLYLRAFDAGMASYCEKNEFIYTRYADDIVVSGSSALRGHLSEFKSLFSRYGLTLNHSKTRIYKNSSQVRFITGLILNKEEIRLPKAMRRRVRVQCHLFLNELDRLVSYRDPLPHKIPPESWKDKELVYDPVFPERIIGKLNYWIHIEPENDYARTMKKLINEKLESF